MPSPGGRNAIVGAFFIVAITLTVAVTAILSDLASALTPTNEYVVRFGLVENAGILAEGAEVRAGGHKVGTVGDVRLALEDGVARGVDVRIEIDRGLILHEDAIARIEIPLLGTGAVINILHTGTGTALAKGGTIAGRPSPGLLAQTGLDDEDIENIRRSIASMAAASERVRTLLEEIEPQLGQSLDGLNRTIGDAQAITASVRERLPRLGDEVESTLGEVRTGIESWTALASRLDERTVALGQVIESVRDTIDTNRPNIDRVIADLAEVAERTRAELLPNVLETTEQARRAAAESAELAADARNFFESEAPGLRRMTANLRLASDQAKLTMLEVRRSPWRLLQRPTTRELEGELLYDATRAFAQAASDLRAASESLISLSTDREGPIDMASRQRAIERLHEELSASFEKYRAAEQFLLDRAIGLGAGGS